MIISICLKLFACATMHVAAAPASSPLGLHASQSPGFDPPFVAVYVAEVKVHWKVKAYRDW
jgi:hypothetical protein